MAHNIETFADGTAAFFSAREVAWHKLGTVTDGALTADDALRVAQMDWYVTKELVEAIVPTADGVSRVPIDGKYATTRLHPKTGQPDVLGIVGERYEIVQNSEAFAFLNNLADIGGAVFETAGSLRGGAKTFVTMKMPDGILVGEQDAVDLYLLATNTHDGSEPLKVAVTPIRAVCQNTVTLAFSEAKSQVNLRHTASVSDNLLKAREALDITFAYADEFQALADAMISVPMSDDDWNAFLHTLLPKPKQEAENNRAEALWSTKFDSINALWKAPTQENIANTRWAAYNAVVEYVDWAAPVRGNKNVDVRRAERTFENAGADLKNQAVGLLTHF